MKKFLIIGLSFLMNVSMVYADNMVVINGEQVIEKQENDEIFQGDILKQKSDEDTATEPKDIPENGSIELEVIHQIDREIVALPTCDDKRLTEQTRKYIEKYLQETTNGGTLQRRRNYFILHSLSNFKQENIADYRTQETSPVSDIIADVKINQAVLEENMLLCKNQSKDKYAQQLYLLVYPKESSYMVRVINLGIEKNNMGNTYFMYQK